MPFIRLRKFPSILTWVRVTVNGSWILSNAFFFLSIEMIMWFFFFCLLLYYINRFSDGKPAFPSWGKPHLECIIFFICCWICMLIFCKKFYIDVHGGYWLVVFIPCDISVLLWYQSNTVFLKISLEVFPPTIIFWK